MAEVYGEDFVVEVETAVADTYVPVANMNRYSDTQTHTNRTFYRFGAARLEVAGEDDDTFTVSGMLDDTDAGQARLVAMKEARTKVKIRVLPNGTDGFSQEVLVLEATHGAEADPETIQDRAFRFRGVGARTKVGTGANLVT